MQKVKINLIKIFTLLLTCVLFVLALPTQTSYRAFADETIAMDSSYVLDDLEGAVINGKKFKLKDYAPDKTQKAQVLSFVEYCYSLDKNMQKKYGLYVYVYNPEVLKFKTDSKLNQINLGISESDTLGYKKYPLQFINQSKEPGYEGNILKFKVSLTEAQKQEFLTTLSSEKRTYKISEIELSVTDYLAVHSYSIGRKFCFTGFAKGCGTEKESTLKCMADDLVVLSLEPQPTYYHASRKGYDDIPYNGPAYITLHSAYFAVPKTSLKTYNMITQAYASFLRAMLVPGLVTGNEAVYNEFNKVVGIDQNLWSSKYFYAGDRMYDAQTNSLKTILCGYSFNLKKSWEKYGFSYQNLFGGYDLDKLYLLFYSGTGADSADKFKVSSAMLKEQMLSLTKRFNYNKDVAGYADFLFSHVDDKPTERLFSSSDWGASLVAEMLVEKYFKKEYNFTSEEILSFDLPYKDAKILEKITPEDLEGEDEKISYSLYVNEGDVPALKNFYEKKKNDYDIYILRYHVSESESQEATLFQAFQTWLGKLFGKWGYKEIDSNAYFFQNELSLQFDILYLTLSNGEKEVVIPVAQTPIDNIIGTNPPPNPTPDGCTKEDALQYVFIILLGLLAVWLLDKFGLLPNIGNFFKKVFEVIKKIILKIIDFFKKLFK